MNRYALLSLIPLLKERPKREVAAPRVEWEGPERPGDEFNRVHSISEVLEWLGFHSPTPTYDGVDWTRPDKERDGSAHVYNDAPDKVTIFSETCSVMWPALETRRPYDAYGLYVVTYFGGDYKRAAQRLGEDGYGDPREAAGPDLIEELEAYLASSVPKGDASNDEITGWEPVDIVAAMRAGPPPAPDLFRRTDGIPLLYRGKINFFYGPPESCKSWAAKAALCSAFNEGKRSIFIDFENDPFSFGEHLSAMGIRDEAAVSERIVYINPDRPYTPKAIATLTEVLKAGAELVVVDGVSNAFNLLGKNPMDHNDIVSFELGFLRPLTISGGAVLAIDHSPKNSENATLFGGQHKKAAITGASYFFSLQKPFGRGMHGCVGLSLDKDKPGYLRKHVEFGRIADLHLYSDEQEMVTFQLLPPGMSEDFEPTTLMEVFSSFVADHPGTDRKAILASTLSEKEDWKRTAIFRLEQGGYIAHDLAGMYRSIKPYPEMSLLDEIRAADFKPLRRPSGFSDDVIDEGKAIPAPLDAFFEPVAFDEVSA